MSGLGPILFVDDDEEFAMLMEIALRQVGVETAITRVCDGQDFERYLSGHHEIPSLVLLDVHLPGTSGLQVLDALRHDPRFKHVPILVLTGSEYEPDGQEARRLGANACLAKPFGFEELVRMAHDFKHSWMHADEQMAGAALAHA